MRKVRLVPRENSENTFDLIGVLSGKNEGNVEYIQNQGIPRVKLQSRNIIAWTSIRGNLQRTVHNITRRHGIEIVE